MPLPTTAVANEFLTAARGMGLGHNDFAVVYDVLAAMSGVKPRSDASGDRDDAAADRAELALAMYRADARIRLFEEQVNQLYMSAKMPGLAHLYIGEEAVAVGVCSALRQDDTSPARIAGTATAWRRAPTRG